MNELFGEEQSIMPIILQGEFAGPLVMTMLYTLSVLVLCCCGTLFESIMNIFMINGLIPGGIAVVAAMFFANLYGVPIFETVVPMLGYTSPIGAVIYMFYVLETQENNIYDSDFICINGAVYAKWVIIFLLFTILYFALTMFLYHKRKAEDVSKPYAFKVLYYILITVITMAISLFARFDFSTVFPVIIFSLIIYMIFEVITNRGFKKIYKSFIRYGVTMTGILILCVTATGTHGFGVQDKTYSPSLVNSVEVNYGGIDDLMQYNSVSYGDWNYYNCFMGEGKTIEYKEKEVIEKVIDVQKQAIETYNSKEYEIYSYYDGIYYSDYYENADMYEYPIYNITFKFNLKTGGTTTRNYILSYEQLKQLFILNSTEELAEYRAEELIDNICRTEYINNKTVKKSYILDYSLLESYVSSAEIPLSKEEAKEFKECYKQDYLETTEEEFLTSKVAFYVGYYPIRECFERTLDFIRSREGYKQLSYGEYYGISESILYPPEGYESFGRDYVTASFGYAETMDTLSHNLTFEQTQELLKYASPCYYEESDCYVMYFDDQYYVIPSEYSDTAEKIYKESVNNENLYTFDQFMADMRNSRSVDDYIDFYLDCNYDCYGDIQKAFEMRYIDYPDENLSDYSAEGDQKKEYLLLKKYFGFTSANEYMLYLDENDSSAEYDRQEIESEWQEYSEAFPQISYNRITSVRSELYQYQ
jgi:hypothetical protein